jgi:hypothetical protein
MRLVPRVLTPAAILALASLPVLAAPVIPLADVAAPGTLRVVADAASADHARAIDFVGDINDDGFDDLAIGAPGVARSVPNSGVVYVVFGRAAAFGQRDFDPGTLDGTQGFRLIGDSLQNLTGSSVARAGDFNADGIDDFVVGAPHVGGQASGAGSIYLIYGRSEFPATIDLSNLAGFGFRLTALNASVNLGLSVSSGRFNDDAFSDLVIGEYSGVANGRAWIVFGQAATPTLVVQTITGLGLSSSPRAVALTGPSNGSRFGWAVRGMPDFNGDGIGDLAVGAPLHDAESGSTYVVFGRANIAGGLGFAASEPITGFTTAQGMQFNGNGSTALAGGRLGSALATGDFNGDGRPDLAMGSPLADAAGRNQAGAVLVVWGTGSNAPSFNRAVADLIAPGLAIALNGAAAVQYTGAALGTPGDTDGDGIDDLLIGAHNAVNGALAAAGRFHLVYGRPLSSPLPSIIDLAALDNGRGAEYRGDTASGFAGFALGQRGDFNGDGRGDVLAGAFRADAPGFAAGGVAYLILRARYPQQFCDGFEPAPACAGADP